MGWATTDQKDGEGKAPAPGEVTRFIHQLGSALGVLSFYPPGHQAVAPSRDALRRRLAEALASGSPLALAVTPEGLLSDGKFPVPAGATTTRAREFLLSLGLSVVVLEPTLSGAVFDQCLDWLLTQRERFTPETIPPPERFPGVRLSTLDYHQVFAGSDAAPPPPQGDPGAVIWERLVGDFLAGRRGELSPRDLINVVSLMEEEQVFAQRISRVLGDSPDPGALVNLHRMLDATRDFMGGTMGLPDPDVLDRIKGCLLSLPEEQRLLVLEQPPDEGGGRAVRDILGALSMEEVADILSSSLAGGVGAGLKRMGNILKLLSLDKDSRSGLLPMLRRNLEAKGNRQALNRDTWQKIQNFLSRDGDQFVSDSYGQTLDLSFREAAEAREISPEERAEVGAFLEDLTERSMETHLYWVLVENLLQTRDDRTFGEMAEEVARLMRQAIIRNDPRRVRETFALLRDAAGNLEAGGGRRERLETLPGQAIDQETMGVILEWGSGNGGPTQQEVVVLLEANPPVASRVLARELAETEDDERRQRCLSFLALLGRAAKSEVVALLGDRRPQVILAALSLVAGMADPASFQRIAPFLAHGEVEVRRGAARVLMRLNTIPAREALVPLIHDPDAALAREVGDFLAECPECTRWAKVLLEDASSPQLLGLNDEKVRKALAGLETLRPAEAVPLMEKILSLRRWFVWGKEKYSLAHGAVQVLTRIGNPQAEAVLRRFASTGPPGIRELCQEALSRFQDRGGPRV
jgi:HEAT repeat protein